MDQAFFTLMVIFGVGANACWVRSVSSLRAWQEKDAHVFWRKRAVMSGLMMPIIGVMWAIYHFVEMI